MTLPDPIIETLELLDTEHSKVTQDIIRLREDSHALFCLPVATFEQLNQLYRERDRLSNVRNNLRAYFDDKR